MKKESFPATVWIRWVNGTRTDSTLRERARIRRRPSGLYLYRAGFMYPVTLNDITGDYHCLIQY